MYKRQDTETLKYYFRDKDGNETNTLPTKYGTVTLTFDKDGNCTYTYTTDGAKLPDHLPCLLYTSRCV